METRYCCYLLFSFVLHIVSSIPSSAFYPFGSSVNDHSFPKNDDGSSPMVKISTFFPFFNSQHDSLFVNTNGAISFQKTLSQFTPAPFPLQDHRSIVAPFWADVDIRNGGTVWYRETTDPAILQRATDEIRLYNPDQSDFHASWVFVSTWDNVAFYGASTIGKTKRNTFQCVLITNGRHSFTVLNYAKVTWTTGTASNGNADTGLGGTPAQVGFNGGDGVNFYALDESRTSAIVNLAHLSNVKNGGKFVFRIDTAKIEKGGCNTGGTLVVYPFQVTMFGSQEITVSGPCFTANDTVWITFPNNDSQPCVRKSEFSARCRTPTFYVTGTIDMSMHITTADGHMSSYRGFCSVVNPLQSEPGLVRVFVGDWARGKTVTVNWRPDSLLFTESRANIDVYTIEPNDAGLPRFIFEKTLANSVIIRQARASFLFDVETNVVVLKMTETGQKNETKLRHSAWSDAFVVKPNLNSVKGHEEAKDTCRRQMVSDDKLPSLTDLNIQPCPCMEDQIEIDLARFRPDPLCNNQLSENLDFRTSRNCQQAEAKQCYRLNAPGPNGSGRLCCYDYLGNLMDAKTPSGGGTAHRYHYLGGPGNVPYLSTLVFDTFPYFYCCKYAKEIAGMSMCTQLLRQRPQGDCRNYQPIRSARLSGDPHFTTLDGLPYTFNGVGEFILLKHINDTFSAQVRMEQVAGPNGVLRKASVITAFSAKTLNVSDTVEVRLNSIRVADVLVNGEIVDFTHYRSLHFIGVSTTMTEHNSTDGSSKQINIIFTDPSLAFRILAYPSLLNVVVVSGSDSLRGNITGLLGNYNDNATDDFTTGDGRILSPNTTAREIHREFGSTWRVRRQDSLFTYPIGKNYTTFQDVAFTPVFPEPNQTFTPEARNICGDDVFCLYDYHTTGRADIAVATRAATQIFESIQRQAEPVIACNQPLDVAYGYWNSTGLVPNSTAVLVCEGGRRPNSSDVISCTLNGTWEHSDDACIEIRCGALPDIPNGRWMASSFLLGTNATLQCDIGSTLNGSHLMTCDENGEWNFNGQTCAIIDCGTPPSISHGQLVSAGTTFGQTAVLECDEGRVPVGIKDVVCGVNGTWETGTQTCDLIDCGHLPALPRGHWVANATTFGQRAKLACEEGRQPKGITTITCGLSGKWNNGTHTCDLVNCGPPPSVANGQWTGRVYTWGSVVRLRCDPGRTLVGNLTINCTAQGQWSSDGQTCVDVDCGNLTSDSHGQWISNGTTFGHTASLKCEIGRQPSGHGNVTCGHRGTWNDDKQTCDLVRCRLPSAVRDGYFGIADDDNCTRTTNGAEIDTYCYYGTVVQHVCETGWTLYGNETALCMADGKWSYEDQVCRQNPASSSTSLGSTVGGPVGGLSGATFTVAIIVFIIRRRRKRTRSSPLTVRYSPEKNYIVSGNL
ncbi:Sushi, nidogen and EGF-like domain-containing protein 1 [Mizuhopecten yessoensis]|uniref:Sushi, nidogen and EGF-like domain-containing protein 1 n=1 Tax=Mizuhopecten yessoensis TaxID=6573 RepID=A0A210Q810_MIZYE|nr:Sushi, nidogen and EGF-like domain-containing protein 1 [Mizuhopecten yessoensis]